MYICDCIKRFRWDGTATGIEHHGAKNNAQLLLKKGSEFLSLLPSCFYWCNNSLIVNVLFHYEKKKAISEESRCLWFRPR
jgi:hypothetical protein